MLTNQPVYMYVVRFVISYHPLMSLVFPVQILMMSLHREDIENNQLVQSVYVYQRYTHYH